MLIHLEGNVSHDYIHFDLPQIYFQQGQSVAVCHVEIDWRRGQNRFFVGDITTSLVDKSPCNPKQQIFRLLKKQGSDYTFHTPTHLLEYKIQCLDLQSSVFKISIFDKDKNHILNSVQGVYLTLLISNAGLQSVHSRTSD